MNLTQWLWHGDLLTRAVALLLLAMSVASWVVIVWKSWLLHRAQRDVARSIACFWQSRSLPEALQALPTLDRDRLVLPLVAAAQAPAGDTLAHAGGPYALLTRVLRTALQTTLRQLQHGQVLLATVGATAPFVGLLGTVWGIYHALTGIASVGQITIDKISGPVGEALIMTAAGLAVAIPAVLAYNVMGRVVARIEADLEGFAHDLRELSSHLATQP